MHIATNSTLRPLIIGKPISTKHDVPQFDTVRLLPGANEVDADTIAAIRKSATGRHWLEKKMLAIVEPQKESDGEGLAGFDSAQAAEFISECMDLETLDRWLDVEKRKDVKVALKARQKELTKAIDHDTRGRVA